MTLAPTEQCSEQTARALTDQLRQSLSTSWELLVEAYQRRAWAALGYESWDAYTDAELGETRLRLPREQRREVVASMTDAGLSTRAIGAALGVDHKTVVNDRRGEFSPPADEVIDAEIVDDDARRAADELVELGEDMGLYDEDTAAEMERSVLGTDGKTYTVQPSPPRRKPLPEQFWQASFDLLKVTDRITKLAADDRFTRNADEVAASHRNDLVRAIDALQGVVNRLPSA